MKFYADRERFDSSLPYSDLFFSSLRSRSSRKSCGSEWLWLSRRNPAPIPPVGLAWVGSWLRAIAASLPLAFAMSLGLSSGPSSGNLAQAQNISPAADGINTQVQQEGNRYDIQGGTEAGANLFHGFEQFNLDSNEVANFIARPDIANILSRVSGGDASRINGLIQISNSSANLFLINPAGILFGPNASLNVLGDFTATSATGIGFEQGWFNSIGDNPYDVLVGDPNRFIFSETALNASVVNLGNLAVQPGQNLMLLGGTVINAGSLSAPQGQIILQAIPEQGMVRLSQAGMVLNLEFETDLLSQGIAPLQVDFEPGSLADLLTGGNFQHATHMIVDRDGTVLLNGSGLIVPTDAGVAIATGTLDVSSHSGLGGTIDVLGNQVGVLEATIEASGTTGGGLVRIGGDLQGQGVVPNAIATIVDGNSVIQADSLGHGTGGTVIIWADQATLFEGEIYARGGSTSGNGGFAEVSGKENLIFQGLADLTAPYGDVGTLLLDPVNITISANPTDSTLTFDSATGIFSFSGTVSDVILNASDLESQLALSNVTISTASTTGTEDGNITVIESIRHGGLDDRSLTLQADNSIAVNAGVTIEATNAQLDVILNSDRDASGEGAIVLSNATVNSNGGDITLGGGSDPTTGFAQGEISDRAGILLENATLDAAGGNITIRGQGNDSTSISASDASGISIDGGQIATAGNGSITIEGIGGRSNYGNVDGVSLSDTSVISTISGNVTLTGTGGNSPGGDGLSGNSTGIRAINNTQIGAGTGNVNLRGIGGNGRDAIGVELVGSGTSVRSTVTGDILIEGTGGIATDGDAYATGVRIDLEAQVSTEDGSLTVTGTGGSGNYGRGIQIFNDSQLTTANGDITLTGTSGPGTSYAEGIDLNTIRIQSTVTGSVTLTGTGANSSATSTGLRIGSYSQILTTEGDITLTGIGGSSDGVYLEGTQMQAGTGNIHLTGIAGDNNSSYSSVGIRSVAYDNSDAETMVSTMISAGGTVLLEGTGGVSDSGNADGISLYGSTVKSTISGNVTLTGTGGSSSGGGFSEGSSIGYSGTGIYAAYEAEISSVGGTIELTGTGGYAAFGDSDGILLDNTLVSSTLTGSISLDGTGGTGEVNNRGIFLGNGTQVKTEAGEQILDGTGGSSYGNGDGISINNSLIESSMGGNITLQGTGSDGDLYNARSGIYIANNSQITTTGDLTLTGQGGDLLDFGGEGGSDQYSTGIAVINSQVSTAGGDLALMGTGGYSEYNGYTVDGVYLSNSTTVLATMTGQVTIEGTAGNGDAASQVGIHLNNSQVSTEEGDLSLTGFDASGIGSGIRLEQATLTSDAHISLTTDSIEFLDVTLTGGDLVNGTQLLTVEQTSATADLSVDFVPVATPVTVGGFSQIIFGRSDGSGNLRFGTTSVASDPVDPMPVFRDPVLVQAPQGSGGIDANAGSFDITFLGQDDATFTFDAAGDIDLFSIGNTGGSIDLISTTNAINVSNSLSTVDSNGLGEGINLSGVGNVTVSSITSPGGTIDIRSAIGQITANSSLSTFNANGSGGSILLNAPLIQVDQLNATGNAGTSVISLIGDELELLGGINSIQGNGALILQPTSPSIPISLGASGTTDPNAGIWDLTGTELATLASGFTSITLGRSDATGGITIAGPTPFNDPVILEASNQTLTINGQITGVDDASITINGSGSTTFLNSNIVTHGNPIYINDAVILQADATLDTTNAGSVLAGADIEVTGAIDGNQALTVDAGMGDIIFGAAVGNNTPLARLSLTTSSAVKISGGIDLDFTATDSISLSGNINNNNDSIDITLTADEIDLVSGTSIQGGVDPTDLSILTLQPFSTGADITVLGTTSSIGDNNLQLTTTDLAALQNGFGEITIGRKDGNGTLTVVGSGNFTFADPLLLQAPNTGGQVITNRSLAATGNLRLEGGDAVIVNDILATINSGTMTLTSSEGTIDTTGGSLLSGGGAIVANAAAGITTGTIDSDSGTISLNADSDSTDGGELLVNGNINGDGGDITLRGIGFDGGTDAAGVNIGLGATVATNSIGTITIDGTGGLGTGNNFGVEIEGTVNTVYGDLVIRGTGGDGGDGNVGVLVSGGTVTITGTSGTVDIEGTGGDGANNNTGIQVEASGQINSGSGGISLTGTGQGIGDSNSGIVIDNAMVVTSGTGEIRLTGTGGNSLDRNEGILITNPQGLTTQVETVNGNITLTGTSQGTGDANTGIELDSGALVKTTGNGIVSFDGSGGNGADNNEGILINNSSQVEVHTNRLDLTGQGNGSGDLNRGITIDNGSIVRSRNIGNNDPITLVGTGGSGSNNDGIALQNSSIESAIVDVTLQSNDSVRLSNSSITRGTSPAYSFNVAINTDSSMGGTNGPVELSSNSFITTDGGNIRIGDLTNPATGNATLNPGILLNDSDLDAEGGSISLYGTGFNDVSAATDRIGISVTTGSEITTTGSGTIVLAGTGGNGTNADGIQLASGTTMSSSNGAITVTGNAGAGGSDNDGIQTASDISSTDGAITIIGMGNSASTGADNDGINVMGGTIDTSTGTGNIILSGTGGAGTEVNDGLDISGATITAATGNITLSGTGGTGTIPGHDGLEISNTTIRTDTGSINITGSTSSGDDIFIDGSTISTTSGIIEFTADQIRFFNTASLESSGGLLRFTPSAIAADLNLIFGTGSDPFATGGFSSITIGRTDGEGSITLAPETTPQILDLTFADPVILQAPNGIGSIDTSTITTLIGSDDTTFSLNAAQDITIAGITNPGRSVNITTTNGAITATSDLDTRSSDTAGTVNLVANGTITTARILANGTNAAGDVNLTSLSGDLAIDIIEATATAIGSGEGADVTLTALNGVVTIAGMAPTVSPFDRLAIVTSGDTAGAITINGDSIEIGEPIVARSFGSVGQSLSLTATNDIKTGSIGTVAIASNGVGGDIIITSSAGSIDTTFGGELINFSQLATFNLGSGGGLQGGNIILNGATTLTTGDLVSGSLASDPLFGSLTNETPGNITLMAPDNITVRGIRLTGTTGPADLSLTSDEIDLIGGTGSITGDGELVLQPMTSNQEIALFESDTALTSTLDLTRDEFLTFVDGFTDITIGRTDSTGTVTLGSGIVTLNDPVTLRGATSGYTLQGSDSDLTVNVTGNNSGTIDASNLTFLDNGSLSFINATEVLGGTGNNSFSLNGGTLVTLEGGTGNDTFNIGAGTVINPILAKAGDDVFTIRDSAGGGVVIEGGDGTDTLDYANVSNGISINLGTQQATGTGGFSDIEVLVGSTLATNDTLTTPLTDTTIDLTGSEAGSVLGIAFSEIEIVNAAGSSDTLNGTSGDDTFSLVSPTQAMIQGITFNTLEVFQAGDGQDRIETPTSNTPISLTGSGAGSALGLSFSEIERLDARGSLDSLAGTPNNDTFVLTTNNAGTIQGITVTGIETFQAGAGQDGIETPATDTTIDLTGSGAGSVLGINFAQIEGLDAMGNTDTLNGTTGNETFRLTSNNAGTVRGITVTGIEIFQAGDGQDRIETPTTDTTIDLSGSGAGSVLGISFRDVEGLNALGNADTLNGSPGDDTFVLVSNNGGILQDITLTGIEIFQAGAGQDTIETLTTDTTIDISGPGAGSVLGISFSEIERLNALGNSDTLNATPGNDTFEFTGNNQGSIQGVITFAGIENVNSGDGDDTLNVLDGVSFGGSVDGGAGDDNLNFSAVASDFSVDLSDIGAVGIETIVGSTTATSTLIGPNGSGSTVIWTLETGQSGNVSGAGLALNFSNFNTVNAGSTDDTFNLESGAFVTIDGGAGNDLFNINGGLITDSLLGGAGNDTFLINDQVPVAGATIDGGVDTDTLTLAAGDDLVTITAQNAGNLSGGPGFNNIENLQGGAGNDTFILQENTRVSSIGGGAGDDRFTIRAGASVGSIDGGSTGENNTLEDFNSTFVITGVNTGIIDGAISFINMQNLTGGNNDDTFRFEGGSLTGNIIGNGGILILEGDEIDIGGIVSGNGALQIQPISLSQDIRLGGGDSGATDVLDYTSTELSNLQDGFTQITIGRNDGSGTIRLGSDVSFNDPILLQSPGGTIDTRAGLITSNGNGMTLNAGDSITTSALASGEGNITIDAGTSISLMGEVTSAGGAITLNAGTDIDTDTLITTPSTNSSAINGGNVDITADDGSITTGDIQTSAISGTLDEDPVFALNGGSVSLNATENITTETINSSGLFGNGGSVNITVENSGIISTGDITTRSDFYYGGFINLSAPGSITTGNLTTTGNRNDFSNPDSINRQDVTLSSTSGSVSTGDIDSSNTYYYYGSDDGETSGFNRGGYGGNVDIVAQDTVITGNIDSFGILGGGDIDLNTQTGDIIVNNLNASGDFDNGNIFIDQIQVSGDSIPDFIPLPISGAVNVNAGANVEAGEIRTSSSTAVLGGDINLSAQDDVITSTILSFAANGNGGQVTIASSFGNINTGTIQTSGSFAAETEGQGGNIDLSAPGAILTGDLLTLSAIGGEVSIFSDDFVTTGAIDTSGDSGDGGSVFIDPPGNVSVAYINTQSFFNGQGGNVSITTNSFFQAADAFIDQNGEFVSISTAGPESGGAITIEHGGGSENPFVVGIDEPENGTLGIITSGEFNLPEGSYPTTVSVTDLGLLAAAIEIDVPPNINVIATGLIEDILEPEDPDIEIPLDDDFFFDEDFDDEGGCPPQCDDDSGEEEDDTQDELDQELEELNEVAPVGNFIEKPVTPTEIQEVDAGFTAEFVDHLDQQTVQIVSPDQFQVVLQELADRTGVPTAIVYVTFSPSLVGEPPTAISSLDETELTGITHEEIGQSTVPDPLEVQLAANHQHKAIDPKLSQPIAATLSSPIAEPSDEPSDVQHLAQFDQLERSPSDELELILVTPEGQPIRQRISGITRRRVLQAANILRNEVSNPVNTRSQRYLAPSQLLHKWIIDPLTEVLETQEIENLLFSMEPGLRSLPVAALHDGEKFIVEDYSVGFTPSLSLTDTRYEDIRETQLLAMGASEFVNQAPLPTVPIEVGTISDTVWEGTSFLNEDFTLENLKEQRQQTPYGIIHLATHADFQSGALENSYIQLYGEERLHLDQLRELGWNDPPVELLTLSACRTALGDEEAELGFAGLAVQAGVKSALASLWYVSDAATTGLMTAFYSQLLEAPIKAEALRQAQLALQKGEVFVEGGALRGIRGSLELPPESLSTLSDTDLSHPYYWAAFTLVGSPW